MSLSKEAFLAAATLKSEEVEIRGQKLTVRELSLAGRGVLVEATKKDPGAAAAVLTELCLLDDSGKPMLTRDECQQLPAEVVEAIADVALRLSGMKSPEKKDG